MVCVCSLVFLTPKILPPKGRKMTARWVWYVNFSPKEPSSGPKAFLCCKLNLQLHLNKDFQTYLKLSLVSFLMTLFIFVDTRSASYQSFKQNTQISAFHEYTLTLIRNFLSLSKEFTCIPPLKALFVNSSPSMTRLVQSPSLNSLSTTLRSR